jgi:hypothetical protein
MPVQDFLQFAKGFTQHEFAGQVATQMKATSQFNREQILKGGQEATGPNGEKLNVYAQINPNKFDDVNYIVHQDGKNVGTYTAEQLQQHGVSIRNMDQEKAQADLDAKKAGVVHTRQQTATSLANMGLHKAKAAQVAKDAESKRIKDAQDQSDKRLTMQLKLLAGAKNSDGVNYFENIEGEVDVEALAAAILGGGKNSVPVVEGIVRMLNDPELSPQTKDVAKAALAEIQRRGDIRPAPSEEIVALKEAYQRLLDQGKTPAEAKDIMLKAHPDKIELFNKPH